MRRVLLAMILGAGVVFGYGSVLASLVHGDGGWEHGCPHHRPDAAEAPE